MLKQKEQKTTKANKQNFNGKNLSSNENSLQFYWIIARNSSRIRIDHEKAKKKKPPLPMSKTTNNNNKKCYDNYVSMKHEVILIREERNKTTHK